MEELVGFDISIENFFAQKWKSLVEDKTSFKKTSSPNQRVIKSWCKKEKKENDKLMGILVVVLNNIDDLKSSVRLKFLVSIGI